MVFPNLLGFISDDTLEKRFKFLEYAVVLRGMVQATNNRIAYYSSVEVLTDDSKQRDILEKKIFNKSDLELLADPDLVKMEYRSDGFKAYFENKPSEYRDWAGIIDEERRIHLYDDLMCEYVLAEDFMKFPDICSIVLAAGKNGSIDVTKVQKRNAHFREVGVSVDHLSKISDAFMGNPNKFLRLDFFHADPTKDKVNKVSASILVTPFKSNFKAYLEAALITPVL